MDPWRLSKFHKFSISTYCYINNSFRKSNIHVTFDERICRKWILIYNWIISNFYVFTALLKLIFTLKIDKCINSMEDVRDIWSHCPKDSLDLPRTRFLLICCPYGIKLWLSHFSMNIILHLILACFLSLLRRLWKMRLSMSLGCTKYNK